MVILDEFRKLRVGVVAVCSYGRSGTSFFMQVLRASGVTVLGAFPHEERFVQAGLLHWLQYALSAPGQEPRPKHFGRAYFRGAFYDCSQFAAAEDYDAVMAAVIAEAQRIADSAPPRCRWLGEKFLGIDTLRLCRTFDASNAVLPLFLMRDPRAIFRSVRAFNARRGNMSFNDTGDDAKLLQAICRFQERQLAEHGRLGGVICRYEELMGPETRDGALASLLTTLRLPAAPKLIARIWEQVDGGRTRVAQHITNASAQAPSAALAEVFASQRESLARLGYVTGE